MATNEELVGKDRLTDDVESMLASTDADKRVWYVLRENGPRCQFCQILPQASWPNCTMKYGPATQAQCVVWRSNKCTCDGLADLCMPNV